MNIATVIAILIALIWFALLVILWIRSNKVFKFLMRLLHEESAFYTARINQGKPYTGLKRYKDLPSQYRMVLEFWKPLSSYEKPLGDYYKDDPPQES